MTNADDPQAEQAPLTGPKNYADMQGEGHYVTRLTLQQSHLAFIEDVARELQWSRPMVITQLLVESLDALITETAKEGSLVSATAAILSIPKRRHRVRASSHLNTGQTRE